MKSQPGPYNHFDDLQLLLRYLQINEDYEKYVDIPRLQNHQEVSLENSQKLAVKIDKLTCECYIRGLMGPKGQESTLSVEKRKQIVEVCNQYKHANLGNVDLPEFPYSESLTPKAKALKPWSHESVQGKWHRWIHYAIKDESEKTGETEEQVIKKWDPVRIHDMQRLGWIIVCPKPTAMNEIPCRPA